MSAARSIRTLTFLAVLVPTTVPALAQQFRLQPEAFRRVPKEISTQTPAKSPVHTNIKPPVITQPLASRFTRPSVITRPPVRQFAKPPTNLPTKPQVNRSLARPQLQINPDAVRLARLPADLVLEALDVRVIDAARKLYRVDVKVRNGDMLSFPPRATYPAGGKVVVTRTSGAVNLTTGKQIALPETPQVILAKVLPELKHGEAATFSVTTVGGAIFAARTYGAHAEATTGNNTRLVNALRAVRIKLTDDQLANLLKLDRLAIHLHRTGSYVTLPGGKQTQLGDLPQKSFGPTNYYISNINSKSTSFSAADGALKLRVVFETGGSEIVGTADGILPNWLAPDINADSLTVTATIPYHFDAARQRVVLDTPSVTLEAEWLLNVAVLPDGLKDAILKDSWINKPIRQGIQRALADTVAELEWKLNQELRQRTAGGHVTAVASRDFGVELAAQVPLP